MTVKECTFGIPIRSSQWAADLWTQITIRIQSLIIYLFSVQMLDKWGSEIRVPRNYVQQQDMVLIRAGRWAQKAPVLLADSCVTFDTRLLSGNLPRAQQPARPTFTISLTPQFVHFPASLVSRSCLCLQTWLLVLMVVMPDELANSL